MGTEAEHARIIAERVARRMSAGAADVSPGPSANVSAELASVRATLSELQAKLARIEAKVGENNEPRSGAEYSTASARAVPLTHSPWLAGVNATVAHPSQERFGIEEATVSELVDFFEKEKTCSVEPGGKPCDHCAMCSSRGF